MLSSMNYNFSKNKIYMDKNSFPGEINNNSLLIDRNEYYNDGNDDNVENYVLKPDISQRTDFKYVNLEILELFLNNYKGGPVLKKLFVEENSKSSFTKKIIEIFYRKVLQCLNLV